MLVPYVYSKRTGQLTCPLFVNNSLIKGILRKLIKEIRHCSYKDKLAHVETEGLGDFLI